MNELFVFVATFGDSEDKHETGMVRETMSGSHDHGDISQQTDLQRAAAGQLHHPHWSVTVTSLFSLDEIPLIRSNKTILQEAVII